MVSIIIAEAEKQSRHIKDDILGFGGGENIILSVTADSLGQIYASSGDVKAIEACMSAWSVDVKLRDEEVLMAETLHSCNKARIGAIPVPGPIMSMGVAGLEGNRKVEGRLNTRTV